ncbi:aldo/keto reductase [Catenulispora yoronensis]
MHGRRHGIHTFRRPGGAAVSTLALGALPFGAGVDEPTSFALLDRFVEAGGTFIDTADCYCFWVAGRTGRESEELLGRWLASRKNRDGLVISTKLGAQPDPELATTWPRNAEGLSAKTVRAAAEGSLRRLGTDHVDVLFAHLEDRSVDFVETVGAFADLVADGLIGQAGVSNHPTSRIKQARAAAVELGVPGYTAVQQRHSFLTPKPGASFEIQEAADDDLLALVRAQDDLSMMAYTALLEGALVREDRPLPRQYQTPQNERRRAALWRTAQEAGVTRAQLALAWVLRGDPQIIPVLGVSTLSQLDDALGAPAVPADALAALAVAVDEAEAEAGAE